MIALEMRNLAVVKFCMPARRRVWINPALYRLLSWLYLVEAGLQLLCGGAGRGGFPGDYAGRAGAWGALSGR
jgi:hypothetical protein